MEEAERNALPKTEIASRRRLKVNSRGRNYIGKKCDGTFLEVLLVVCH